MKNKLIILIVFFSLITMAAYASTTHYSYNTPTVGGSQNTWGTLLNTIFNSIDTNIWQASNGTTIGLNSVTTGSNVSLANPINNLNSFNFSTTGKQVNLPPMNATSSPVAGGVFWINNTGTNSFAIDAADGSTSVVSSLAGSQSVAIQALSNSTTNGTFLTFGPFLSSIGTITLGTSAGGPDPAASGGSTTGLFAATTTSVGISVSGTAVATFTSTGLNNTAIGATTSAAGTFTTITGANAAISGTTTTANLHVTGTCTGCGTAGIGQVTLQSFCASGCTHTAGTYTPTSGMKYITVQMVGGGGGGGGIGATPSLSGSAGGSGGEYAYGVFSAATVGASQTITLGAGGLAGVNTGGNGGNGGTTSIGAILTAVGGNGGGGTNVNQTLASPAGGGSGGTGTGVHTTGMTGTFGQLISGLYAYGGEGANSQFGSGGTTGINSNGNAAAGYGGGGGGTGVDVSGTGYTGGAGSPGIVIITEYQ